MIFSDPLPFQSALEILDSKDPLPTDLSSAEIREQWPEELRQRSIFSARTTKGELLQTYKDQLEELIKGGTNTASARHEVQRMVKALDYLPEQGGFPGNATVPPAAPGSLRDLSSNARVDLVVKTNVRQVAAAAQMRAGQTDSARYWFPALELIRISPRLVPRGMKVAGGKAGRHLVADPGHDWPSRWEKAGGQFYGGRMIALKDAEVWDRLGSSALFPDGLDAPFEPFAFNSGYGRRPVARRDCLALGVITGKEKPDAVTVRMNEGLQASAKNLDDATLAAIRKGLDARVEDAMLKLKATGYDLKTGRYINREALIANVGSSEGASKGWITRRAGKMLAVRAFQDAMKPGGHAMAPRAFLRVDSGSAARIKRDTGLDVAGYEHVVDGSSVRHAMRQHGDPAAEAKRGQKAITEDDFRKLPIIVSKADRITRGPKTPGGLDTIVYQRKVGDDTLYVEEVRTGKKQLAAKTMWKK